jgi:hypothetical protein
MQDFRFRGKGGRIGVSAWDTLRYADTPTRRYAHTFLSRGAGTIGATKPTLNASDEQIRSPVYEAIRDYWIDSRLGPGYSPH